MISFIKMSLIIWTDSIQGEWYSLPPGLRNGARKQLIGLRRVVLSYGLIHRAYTCGATATLAQTRRSKPITSVCIFVGNGLIKKAAKTIIDDSQIVLDYLGTIYPEAALILADHGQLTKYHRRGGIRKKDKLPTVDEALHKLADLYLDRNKLYRDNYKKFGALMVALQNFVPGGKFPTETEDDWNRLCMLFMLASKMSRYCANYTDGGHPDSLDDDTVYAQMLNEIDREIQSAKEDRNVDK